MLLRILIVSALLSVVESIGLAPGLYCGLETCYEVLGINRDEFNKTSLSKIYRQQARNFHPDRVKSQKDKKAATEKFQLITTAYETLKDDETRGYYDYYLDHPEERYYNYYQYYRMKTPKVDVRLVIGATIILISSIQYLSAKQKYSEALEYAKEQIKFRNMALSIAQERKLLEFDRNGKPKKKQANGAEVDKVLGSIIEEHINVSGGYKKESLKDTLLYALIICPYTIILYVVWWVKWYHKYNIKKEEYDDDAKMYLIRKNLGLSEDQYNRFEDEIIDEHFANNLWVKADFEKWKAVKDEEDKDKLANSARYKQYRRYMKKTAGQTISFLDEM